MTTVAERLETLNTLREQNDQAPLKSWKRSRAQLEEAIAELEAQTETSETTEETTTSRWTIVDPGRYNRNRHEPIGIVDVEHSTYRNEERTGTFELVKNFTPFSTPRGGYAGYIKIQDEAGSIKVRVRNANDGYTVREAA